MAAPQKEFERVAGLIGIEGTIRPGQIDLMKQNTMPLLYAIENYDAVAQALSDTEYETYLSESTDTKKIISHDMGKNSSTIQKAQCGISVVMLTHNDYEKTRECIESLIPALSHEVIREFIILDNCSTDRTREYVASLSRIGKIKIELSDENLGVTLGRKKLFGMATAGIVMSLDSDVMLRDINFIYKAYAVLMNNPKVGICGMSGYFLDFGGGLLNLRSCESEGFVHCVSGCCQIFWKYLLGKASLDDAFSPFWCEDTDFCFQIVEQGKLPYYIPPDYGLVHEYRSKEERSDLSAELEKKEKERYLVDKWKNASAIKDLTMNRGVSTEVAPKLWVMKLDDRKGDADVKPDLPAAQVVLTQNNLHDYLPELKETGPENLLYVQMLLLFKYGGACIHHRYLRHERMVKRLCQLLPERSGADLVLAAHRGSIQSDVMAGRKGSTLFHKCIVCKKIQAVDELPEVFGDKCVVVEDLISGN